MTKQEIEALKKELSQQIANESCENEGVVISIVETTIDELSRRGLIQEHKQIKWAKVNPRYGYGYHVFAHFAGPFKLIDAHTNRRTGTQGKEEPLWYGILNGTAFGPFWDEKEAIETVEAALKLAGYLPPSPQEGQ